MQKIGEAMMKNQQSAHQMRMNNKKEGGEGNVRDADFKEKK